jgi:hypothetical protein
VSSSAEISFVDQFSIIIMACRQKKMQVLQAVAVAVGLLCMSALLNGAEASVSASNKMNNSCRKLIDTYI